MGSQSKRDERAFDRYREGGALGTLKNKYWIYKRQIMVRSLSQVDPPLSSNSP